MGKSPVRWIKNLLLGKRSSKSNMLKGKEKLSHRFEQAATTAQAGFRGYLACRAFCTLKGIIRPQALICGLVVRRQAVATLCSTWGIVKFQALVCGQKVRRTGIAIEVQKIYLRALRVAKSSSELSASARVKNLSNNAFVRKLLSSSPTVLPLQLQYGPGEPNLARKWLECWMRLHFWEPPQPIRSLASKSQTKVERDEHDLENEKHKRNPRKVSTNPADRVQEQPQNEIEKILLRRNVVSVASAKVSNLEANPKLSTANDSVEESNTAPAVDSQPTEGNGKVENMHATDKQLSSKDGTFSRENLNTGQRRASLPRKIDNKENGLYSTPKVLSYMAPTESVKAKLRGQGSPRFSCDVIEKNGVTRWHSLPSAIGSNLSSLSSRARRLVQASGKGAMRNDKSLSSSRDAGAKKT
ncbi:hypothetical protein SLE2022_335110 [Rubroshorea leprosula]